MTLLTKGATTARRHAGGSPPPPAGARAFPSAEGFGAEALGGRGSGLNDSQRMTIYKVTTLNDPTTRAATFDGSLRWAVEATGPRVVVFGVAGYITLSKKLAIANDKISILGHTAPGDGVCLKATSGAFIPFSIEASHVIVRYLRCRPFADPATTSFANSHTAFAVFNKPGKVMTDVIIDHCSGTWAYDVCVQVLGGKYSKGTIQWCIAAEGYQFDHQRLLATYGGEDPDRYEMRDITFHHNLIARGDFRTPQVSTPIGAHETINNVGYFLTKRAMNINVGAHKESHPEDPFPVCKYRVIGNIWTKTHNPSITNADTGIAGPANCISDIKDAGHNPDTLVYSRDNIGPGRTTDAQPAIDAHCDAELHHYTSDPLCTGPVVAYYPDGKFHHPAIPVADTTPWQAWHDVLGATNAATKSIAGTGYTLAIPAGSPRANTNPAGASLPVIDSCDQRILDYCKNDTLGSLTVQTLFSEALSSPNGLSPGVYPTLGSTPANAADNGTQAWAPAGDGIPSAWVSANIPGGKFPYSLAPNGYTYAENYWNGLAGDVVP